MWGRWGSVVSRQRMEEEERGLFRLLVWLLLLLLLGLEAVGCSAAAVVVLLGVAVVVGSVEVVREPTKPEMSREIMEGDGVPRPGPGVAGAGVLMAEDVAGGRGEKSGGGPAP